MVRCVQQVRDILVASKFYTINYTIFAAIAMNCTAASDVRILVYIAGPRGLAKGNVSAFFSTNMTFCQTRLRHFTLV
jgi:hypothetical protein